MGWALILFGAVRFTILLGAITAERLIVFMGWELGFISVGCLNCWGWAKVHSGDGA
jgi:hypothetical protein